MSMTLQEQNVVNVRAIKEEMRGKTVDELWGELRECMGSLAPLLARAAACVSELVERGEAFDLPYKAFLLSIAEERLLPEFAATIIDSPNCSILERLPLKDQKRLAKNPVVEVVERNGSGFTKRTLNVTTAPRPLVTFVAKPEGLLTPEQQEAQLRLARSAAEIASRTTPAKPLPEKRIQTLRVKLTPSEMALLEQKAKDRGVSVEDWAYLFLDNAGAFKKGKG